MPRRRRHARRLVLAVAVAAALLPSPPATAAIAGESSTSTVESRLKTDPNVQWVGTWESTDWTAKHGVGTYQYKDNTAITTLSAGGTYGKTLRGRTPKSWTQGFGYHASFDRMGMANYDQLYFRYRVYFPSNYVWTNSSGGGGGKLPGLAGKLTGGTMTDNMDTKVGSGGKRWNSSREVYRSNLADADSFSARLLWTKDGGLASYIYAQYPLGPQSTNSYYGYSARCKIAIGSWDNRYFNKGAWNTVEQRVQMNTPGVKNGIFQVWMNGNLCIDMRDVMWRSSKRTTLRITQMYMTWYYGGGSGDAPSADSYMYIDDAVLSKAYIGPRR